MPEDATGTLRDAIERRPRFDLAHLPTPLEPCPHLPTGHRLFVKRDDSTGFALGGNKSRKLEFTLGDALERGATALLTASGIQSNHVRQSAAAAARAGMSFHGVVAAALDRFPNAHLDSGNVLIDLIYGAHLHLVGSEDLAEARMAAVSAMLECQGERPYVIPLGASDGIGSCGYAACALELLDDIARRGADVSHVFLPTGSGGTQGGLLTGLRLAGSDIAVVGISVSEPRAAKIAKVRASMLDTARVLGFDPARLEHEEIEVHDGYTGQGYAHPTDGANNAIVTVARAGGPLLDPVYTGKAWHGMVDLVVRDLVGPVRDVVFLHTGGSPALFADPRLVVSVERDAPELSPLRARAND